MQEELQAHVDLSQAVQWSVLLTVGLSCDPQALCH